MLKPHSKAPRGLVALGSAAIIAVYGAGYARTRTAGSRFVETPALRRPSSPAAAVNMAAVNVSQAALPVPARSEARTPVPQTAHSGNLNSGIGRAPSRDSAAGSAAPKSAGVAPDVLPVTPATPATAASTATATVSDVALNDAAAKPPTDATPAPPAKAGWRDGTFYGWGSSRHGDIQAAIVIVDGRIAGASIAQCLTRYSCSWIAHLPAQVIARQSADVDFVTGATQSVDAFYYAVLDALSKAK